MKKHYKRENVLKDKKYMGEFAGQKIEADSKKDYIYNALAALYKQYKNLPNGGRVKSYASYFANNFSYDKTFGDEVISNNGLVTAEAIEDQLFKLIKEGKGVCQQFAQALTLLTKIDYEKSGNGLKLNYAVADVVDVKGRKVFHAFNVVRSGSDVGLIIDISSMIHCMEGDYKQEANAFYAKTTQEYYQNMKSEGAEVLPGSSSKVFIYPEGRNFDDYYQLLNSDEEIYGGVWLNFDKDDIENGI